MISLGGRHLAAQGNLFQVTTMTSHCTLSKSNGQPDLCLSHSLLLPFASNEICLLHLESTAFLDCVFISLTHFSPWINQLPSVSLGVFTWVSKIGAILTVLSILSIVARITCVEQDQEYCTLAACVNQEKAPLLEVCSHLVRRGYWHRLDSSPWHPIVWYNPHSGTPGISRCRSVQTAKCCHQAVLQTSHQEQDPGGARLFAGSAMIAV